MALKFDDNTKKLALQALVIVICLGFILETFAFGNRAGSAPAGSQQGDIYSGVAIVQMTVVDYRPYLYVDDGLNGSLRESAAGLEGVDEILDDGGRTVISLSSPRDAPAVYGQLRRMGVLTYTLSSVSTPAYFEVTLQNGSTRGVSGSRFDYLMEPVTSVGGKIMMRMSVQAIDGRLDGIGNVMPMVQFMDLEFNASVENGSGRTFYYAVPWESRGLDVANLTAQFGTGNVEYVRNDNILLAVALTPQEMLAKKYDYVATISERSITVAGDFTDKGRIALDFGNVTYHDSSLIIRSGEDPGLAFPHEERTFYTLALPETVGGYNLYEESYSLEYAAGLEGEIPVVMNASVLGETIEEINGIRVVEQG
ncbi:MAG: hypothetical protein PHY95_04340 [Candidatus ainarchaeum sp.]|nr:hypothetical protein [Candidatus ainarchaeum sp.]